MPEVEKDQFSGDQNLPFQGHSMSDPQKYRTRDELNSYRDQDPIQTVKGYLLDTYKVKEDVIKSIHQAVKEEVADA